MPENNNPLEEDSSDIESEYSLEDLVSQRLFGGKSYNEISAKDQSVARSELQVFEILAGNLNAVVKNIERDTITFSQRKALDYLLENEETKEAFINEYYGNLKEDSYSDREAQVESYLLYEVLDKYKTYINTQKTLQDSDLEFEDIIQRQLDQMGDFKSASFFDTARDIDTSRRLNERLYTDGRKFRQDNPPKDIGTWQCRIGASTFYVPPTNIEVFQSFSSTSLSGAAIRQPNSPKINMGHSETMISMTIYFPTHETIWGFEGDEAEWQLHQWDPQNNFTNDTDSNILDDAVIDNYLSSLRGLITQFKYSPFLPVKNDYLNRSHEIDAVAMKNMTISTVEGFPFVAAVTLEMQKFNYKPFMPMITHFDQALHWGKFRSFLSRAAISLDKKVNKGFLIEIAEPFPAAPGSTNADAYVAYDPEGRVKYENEYTGALNKVRDIDSGKNFDLYYPISTPSRIFAGDTADFRQAGEDEVFTQEYWGFILEDLGIQPTSAPNFFFDEYDSRRKVLTSERTILLQWLDANAAQWELMNSDAFEDFIQEKLTEAQNGTTIYNKDAYEERLRAEWFYVLFDKILKEDPIFSRIREGRQAEAQSYTINEWEVPMAKASIDWSKCIVKGVGVSISNRFASLQVQLQDEPTLQHIGGGDSSVDVEMTILGQENLIAFRRLFQHINGLGRLERQHGVLGFLGVKNIFTSLAGIKYLLPLSMEVGTKPGYPDVYDVRISFTDFDVMQQRRENLSSDIQKDLIDNFGKRNPFFRIKQSFGAVKLYPDFPLEVYDDDDKVIGHLDPDWYFRSFIKDNTDLIHWGASQRTVDLLQEYGDLVDKINTSGGVENAAKLVELQEELIAASRERGSSLPLGWEIDDKGRIKELSEDRVPNEDEREYRYFLGAYGENQQKLAVIDMFPGAYFRLGEIDKDTKQVEYITDFSALSEDLASYNLKNRQATKGTVNISEYQNEYTGGYKNPNRQYESMIQDWNYRNTEGRMVKAFPTYMLWLIDEGGRFAGIKLFDNLYGLNSIIDFSVVSSAENPISDTLVLRLSNMYQKITRSYTETLISEDDSLAQSPVGTAILTSQNRDRNFNSGLYDSLVEVENLRLKPGIRLHLRGGYGSNPNALDTIFNGTITEVQSGEIVTVVAQADAVEFSSYVNVQNEKGHSGKIDGGLNNFWLSEPRDLIVRLLSMGSSNFREWLSWGTKGVFFSESRFGIRHFGSILYEPMTKSEVIGTYNKQAKAMQNMVPTDNTGGIEKTFGSLLGDLGTEFAEIDKLSALPGGGYNSVGILGQLVSRLYTNSISQRDYEVFKRNIYPGNGTGVAQFMGGDLLDAGILITQATREFNAEGNEPVSTGGSPTPNELGENAEESAEQVADNTESIDKFWQNYYSENGISRESLNELLSDPNLSAQDLNEEDKDLGLIERILSPKTVLTGGLNLLSVDSILELNKTLPDGLKLIDLAQLSNPITASMPRVSSAQRFMSSSLGQALGLSSIVEDDDLQGFGEVSFRAQTYMKSVWEMFEVCAALLPNYIVAVRPFEDRSTLFYGKPHWLYTSGLIPITTGVQSDLQSSPRIDKNDSGVSAMLAEAGGFNEGAERIKTTVRNAQISKSPTAFSLQQIDPYNVTGGANILPADADAAILANNNRNKAIENFSDILVKQIDSGLVFIEANEVVKDIAMSELTEEEISTFAQMIQSGSVATGTVNGVDLSDLSNYETGDSKFEEVLNSKNTENIKVLYQAYKEYTLSGSNRLDSSQLPTQSDKLKHYDEIVEAINNEEGLSPEDKTGLVDVLNTDPITFAHQFGWKYSRVPVYIKPEIGAGIDRIGKPAVDLFDEDASEEVDIIGAAGGNSGRSLDDGEDIWYDFRRTWRYYPQAQKEYIKLFPEEDEVDKYDEVVDQFLRFLWQDSWNRAWVVLRANRYRKSPDNAIIDGAALVTDPVAGLFGSDGIDQTAEFKGIDFATGDEVKIDRGADIWLFDKAISGAWATFLSSQDVRVEDGFVISPKTQSFMRSNAGEGNSATNVVTGAVESTVDWFNTNVGQVIGLVGDSISGLIQSLRVSMAQLSSQLSQSGEFQRQAEVLNDALMDSIYYQLGGGPGEELLRAVDNPFTREYGEPVLEIREPFQRVHMVSSFNSILDNQIRENLDGVATTVTALSNGGNPVTTHLDKGIPPDRQIESIVETGIYFDNVYGSGLLGFLHPLVNPLETLRGASKLINNTSDQLSARRIGLYHLRNNVKNIYDGELIVMGNTQIRPWDLLYISDNYERMFGLVEVSQVVHHFTPETGFITSITPNALVSVNDPARWTMTAYLRNKMTDYAMRDEMRALMNINTERFIGDTTRKYSDGSTGDLLIPEEDLYNQFSEHIQGSVQWTQGNTALIRDFGAIFAGGGVEGLRRRDEVYNQIVKFDIAIGAAKPVLTALGGAGGFAAGGPTAAVATGAAGYIVSDLLWEAWQWVKDNLLDQQGCQISFLTKDGQPMDAGLSYFQGNAVGSNHMLSLFPNVFGIQSPKTPVKEDGKYRITTNDLLARLGWTEVDTVSLHKDLSMFVNETNSQVLELAGRGPNPVAALNDDYEVFICRLARVGEEFNGEALNAVIDGDTIDVVVLDVEENKINNPYAPGSGLRIRLSAVNTAELLQKNRTYTDFDEVQLNPDSDLARLAQEFLETKFSNGNDIMAVRVKKSERQDVYGRTLGTIFHNVPFNINDNTERIATLFSYANANPPVAWDSYLSDGRPHTVNWELVMAGFGKVDLRDSLWDTDWRNNALEEF